MRKTLLALASLLFTLGVTAQPVSKVIPLDSTLRTGTLPNGLTYYLLRNGYPEHRVNFYIAQRVGSIQEEDHQQGLAHFLEHMCFNGTEHFPANTVISYLESLGVKFGENLNAYTSIDRTVYNINNVPSTRGSALDSCLLVLRDWSCGLKLDSAEIDKERGVIHEEWRLRSSASSRLLERNLETLYPGSKYGRRMPIGKMEIVDNFPPAALRSYYHTWYHPDNQAIIVVGDIDVDGMERRIRQFFTPIPRKPAPQEVREEPVPDNEHPIIVVDSDREQQLNVIQLMFKHDAVTRDQRQGEDYYRYLLMKDITMDMLRNRLNERAQEPDCPYTQVAAGYGTYLISKTKYAFQLTVVAREGRTVDALRAAMSEAMRAVKHGFTPTEFARSVAAGRSTLDRRYAARNKRNNAFLGNQCVELFLTGEPMPSPETQYRIRLRLLDGLRLQDANDFMRSMTTDDNRNLVIVNFNPAKPAQAQPTGEMLLAAVREAESAETTPYIDKVREEPLVSQLPRPGRIVSQKKNKRLGFKELHLSNGATILLKKTDFKADEVILNAYADGGSSLLGEADYPNMRYFNRVINGSGLGAFSLQELGKALAGKTANINIGLEAEQIKLFGSTTPRDMETLLQQTYLYFTAIRKDQRSFDNLMAAARTRLKNIGQSPDMALSDSLMATLYNHNPRFANSRLADIDRISYDRILQIAREQLSNAASFTFTFVGNFDEAALLPLIEQYIASLPSTGKRLAAHPVETYARGTVVNKFRRKMETPKAKAYMLWYAKNVANTLDNQIMASALGQVLTARYIAKIREEASAAYSADGSCSISRDAGDTYVKLYAICPIKPEKADTALRIMYNEVISLSRKVEYNELDKVKRFMAKRHDEQLKQNYYWIKALETYHSDGLDTVTDYHSVLSRVTPVRLSAFLRSGILRSGNHIEVIMLPE